MQVNRLLIPILALSALFGTVLVAQATGQFATNGRAGTDLSRLTPTDLKGWMTLQDVLNGLQISKDDLYAAGSIPAEIPPTTALNRLEAQVPGFSVTSLRDILTAKLGSANATTRQSAANDSTGQATPTTVSSPAVPSVAIHATPTPLPAGQLLPASQIKGSMTLKSVSEQCGVPLAQIVAGLNLPADTNPDALIKELVGQGKISEVTAVQKVVGGLQSK